MLKPLDVILRRFELNLLEQLGYGLPLGVHGEHAQAIEHDKQYLFDDQQSVFFEELAGDANKTLVNRFNGADLLALADGEFTDPVRKSAKRLCRLALRHHLGSKPLKSRELFN